MLPPDVHTFTADQPGERLDLFIVRMLSSASRARPSVTRSRIRRLIDEGRVTVDGGRPAKAGVALEPGQRVRIETPEARSTELVAEERALRIVYEDDDLIVVDKPAGMTVHPSPGHNEGTLVHALLGHSARLSSAGGGDRPGIVHRLDKDTSGLLIVAKHDAAHLALAKQLKDRSVEKTYVALIEGHLEPAEGMIDAPIARHPARRQKMAIVSGGRASRTRYRVLRELSAHSLVELQPETGRTHQLRVHLASIGHPVAGDRIYGSRKGDVRFPRQLLHAQRLVFVHPTTGARIELEAKLPEDLRAALARL